MENPPKDHVVDGGQSFGCTPSTGKPYKGFREVHREQQLKRRNRTTPPPWIARKLAVIIVIALIIFATYVYVARACVPLIRRDSGAVASRTVGVVFLCIYSVFWVMCIWTYAKVISTPPGFARDFVQKCAPPASTTIAGPPYQQFDDDDESIDHYQHREDDYESQRNQDHSPTISRVTTRSSAVHAPRVAAASYTADQAAAATEKSEHHEMHEQPPRRSVNDGAAATGPKEEEDVTEMAAFAAVGRGRLHNSTRQQRSPGSESTATHTRPPRSRGPIELGNPNGPPSSTTPNESGLPPEATSRQPPRHATLAEEYRYCQRDGFVKPMRTHHCRICATCVLNFDHHCPWIGQCVGARNRKFFMNFVLWGSIYCLWICISLAVLISRSGGNPDAPQIVVVALTAVFGLFTLGLFITHTYLLMLNLTTIEEYSIKGMQEKEEYMLASMFPWWNIRAKTRMRRTWDEEWGKLKTEGNIWWLGSSRKNWEQTMGKNPWGWFLPIGAGESDGLTYPTNPRFTSDGRWRRRSEWDPELR